LQARLMRYLSPPLFPVHLSELPCKIQFHQVSSGVAEIGEFRVSSALVCHPGPTVGYRIAEAGGGVLTYLPDHEPALGCLRFPCLPRAWTSGGELAAGADLLIHDGQYSSAEYPGHCGWGHSSLKQTLDFGTLTEVRHLVPFHHDPGHTDSDLDRLMLQAMEEAKPAYRVTPGVEGTTIEV
jgi:ribonuclease BN (tRNA processing enzyme)